MFRFFSTLLIVGLISAQASAAQWNYSCSLPTGGQELLKFVFDTTTNTISFSNIDGFGSAQMQKNEKFPMQPPFSGKARTIQIEYNWYFTAQYEITFEESIWQTTPGPSTYGDIWISGNDSDGANFDDVRFSCRLY